MELVKAVPNGKRAREMFKLLNKSFTRVMEAVLALHGVLHVFEFGTAMLEEAYLTASIAALGATSMLYATYFMEEHIHHHGHPHEE